MDKQKAFSEVGCHAESGLPHTSPFGANEFVPVPEIRTYLGKFTFEFDASYFIDRVILQYGDWEPHVLNYFNKFVKPGMLAVDVGANVGYHTLVLADLVGAEGKVYAFEPNAFTRKRLLRNLELNPDLQGRVTVCEQGVGAKQETLYVAPDLRPESIGNASLSKNATTPNSVAVSVVKLDDFVSEPISFLKIDVEGMELQVLEGCRRHIEESRPVVVFETLRSSAPEVHKPVEDYLKQFGYKIFCCTPSGKNLIEIGYPMYPFDDCVAAVL